MGFRFWRRIRIAPGVTLNLSKSGGSLSFGPRGAKFTVGPRGKRVTVGLPGTGLFYTTKLSDGGSRVEHSAGEVSESPEERLTLGFFQRLATPDDEKALVDGCRELVLGDEDKAFEHLEQAVHLADGAYLAGVMALKRGLWEKGIEYLSAAAENHHNLGKYFDKYGISATSRLAITHEVVAQVGPNLRGVLLALVETYQRLERWEDAVACLERLLQLEPEDVVVKLSLAELLLTARPGDRDVYKRVVELTEGVENQSYIHAALLLYKARALQGLGLLNAARDTLTAALRRRKDRPSELLKAIRYQRALVYQELGQSRRGRSELERLYAEDPDYEDVAERLGVG